jgi:type IV pilus assembly protein PilV
MNLPLVTRRRARGVTLIEVLVTMVIVAVGLLGLAGMQVRGLSIQKDAHGRALATQLALDIADRMRSNVGAVGNYAFTTAYPTGAYTPGAAPTPCVAVACTAVQQAQYDFDQWFTRVRTGALPGGWARIAAVAGTPAWEVTLMWQETGFRRNDDVRTALGSSCQAVPVAERPPPEVECVTVRVWP